MSTNGKSNGHEDIRKLLDEDVVLRAAQIGAQRALRIHKALGNPIATVDENGNVVLVQPEDIELGEMPPLWSDQGLK